MPKPYPRECRADVVRVARNREPGVTVERVARDFGVHSMTLQKWLRQADVEDGVKPGVTADAAAELRELKRRNRLLEQEPDWVRKGITDGRWVWPRSGLPRAAVSVLRRWRARGAFRGGSR